MKTRNRYWLLLLLAAVSSLALAACDANDLTPDTGGDRAVDGSPRPGDDGDGDDDGIDFSADDDGDGLADLEDVTVDERVEFIGRVESIADGAWLVDDCRLVLVEETEVEGADDDRDDKDKDKDKDDEDDDGDDNPGRGRGPGEGND